jgi:hypothetical protein
MLGALWGHIMTTSSPTNSAWTIGSVLSESWRKVAGFKATYAIAMIIYVAVALAAELVMGLLFGWDYAESASGDALTGAVILEIVISIAMIPLGVGLGLISVRRAAGKPVNPTLIFEPYQHALPIIVMIIMMFFLIIAGYLLFIIPGIYLSVAYSFAPYLITEKNMGAWQSLEESRKAITKYWWRYFGLMWVSLFLIIAGTIPFLIGLIWVLPLVTIAVGEVFARTFDDEPAMPARDPTVD